MHLRKTLEQLGFTGNASVVYLTALELGEATISEIAQKAGMPRTSCQTIIRELKQAGLLNFYAKRRRKYWIAENPEKLLIGLKEKEAALKEIMPQLQALRHDTGAKPTVKFYSGIAGIKLIFNDIIETKRHFVSLTSLEDALSLMGDEFHDFIERRHKHFLRVSFLTHRSPETEELKKRDNAELRHTRFLPENFNLKNANFMYGDKVAIISLNRKMPVGIIIEDADIAKTQVAIFEFIWAHSAE